MWFLLLRGLLTEDLINITSMVKDEPIICNNTRLQIVNTSFLSCVEPVSGRRGGAISATFSGVTVQRSSFLLCVAYHGGAMWFTDSSVSLDNVNTSENSAFLVGGAGIFRSCHLQITGGVSKRNEAQYTGGMWFAGSTGIVRNHVMLANTAHSSESGGLKISEKPIDLSKCVFIHNHAESGYAGAIFIDKIEGTQLIDDCRFISNEITGDEISERQISIATGTHKCIVRVSLCKFDSPLDLSIGVVIEAGGQPGQVERVGNTVDLQTDNPWLREAGAVAESHWTLILTHADSGLFAAAMVIIVPAFIFGCAFLLNIAA